MIEELKNSKVIAAIKGEDSLTEAINSDATMVFILRGSIMTVRQMVERIHKAGKKVYIHMDLIDGFGKDQAAIEFMSAEIKPDGILSTRNNIIKFAKDFGISTIFRVFLVDSQSLETAINNVEKLQPDAMEIMPGVAYEAIRAVVSRTDTQVIAGGFVRTEQNVRDALSAGAVACSTSVFQLWSAKI
ncbi:MAG: glycerol-3-phosphate responsive antiterminator [Clostridia bacterium]